jgi:hypothetical protein
MVEVRLFTSIYVYILKIHYKIEGIPVFKTSHHGEVGDENQNPTIVGLCA